MLFKIGVLKNKFKNVLQNTFWSLFLIKLQACNFIKKRLLHMCFPVNIAKFLRTPILKNIFERLLFMLVVDITPITDIFSSLQMRFPFFFLLLLL